MDQIPLCANAVMYRGEESVLSVSISPLYRTTYTYLDMPYLLTFMSL